MSVARSNGQAALDMFQRSLAVFVFPSSVLHRQVERELAFSISAGLLPAPPPANRSVFLLEMPVACKCMCAVDVTLYRAPNSAEGQEARAFFDRKGVACEDLDITARPEALRQAEQLTGQSARPVIVVDGQVFVGYDPSQLDRVVPSLF